MNLALDMSSKNFAGCKGTTDLFETDQKPVIRFDRKGKKFGEQNQNPKF